MMSFGNLMVIGENINPESTLGERFSTGLEVALIGMLVVFGVLLLLMAVLYIFKAVFAGESKKKSVEPVSVQAAKPVSASPAASASLADEEKLAAIAAATIAAYNDKSDCAYEIISINKIA